MRKRLKLALIDTVPFWFDGDRYSTNSAFISLVLSFKRYFGNIILLGPVIKSNSSKGEYYIETRGQIEVVPLPAARNDFAIYMKSPYYLPIAVVQLLKTVRKVDIAWVVPPHPLSVVFWMINWFYRKKAFLWIRGDHEKDFKLLYPRGLTGLLANALGRFLTALLKLELRNSPAFVTGSELWEKYRYHCSRIHLAYPSLISESDISPLGTISEKWKMQERRLLSVGRLTSEKGLEYLIEALPAIIEKSDLPVRLTIVGNGAKRESLERLVHSSGLGNCVEFRGYVPFGQKLFKIYSNSHIFVLPSLTEGIPKTVYEAMAKGVAIVSTRVGGVPDVIKSGENGLLIPPRNSNAITEGVLNIISCSDLRIKIIRKGLETAREFTLERQRRRIVDILRSELGIEIN